MTRPLKVIYICGMGRSGSTILDRILGQIPGFFSGGEIRVLWDAGLASYSLCGCGEELGRCEIWNKVFEAAFGGSDRLDPDKVAQLRRWGRTRASIPGLLGGERLIAHLTRPCIGPLAKFYHTIADVTGCSVVVDSSKVPIYGYLLRTLPDLSVYLVHLVRDPRAVAYSWQRIRRREDVVRAVEAPRHMARFSVATAAAAWLLENLTVQRFWRKFPHRYLRLRYEDLIADPRKALADILAMVDETVERLPFVGDHSVELGVNHTVSGNPTRLLTGKRWLQLDDEWRSAMGARSKLLVGLMTLPLMYVYDYPLFGSGQSDVHGEREAES